jgi:hypothetical protein
MSDDNPTIEHLTERGWQINQGRGTEARTFTSVSFCLVRRGVAVKCVQGYGATRTQALADAAREATAWVNGAPTVHVQGRLEPRA